MKSILIMLALLTLFASTGDAQIVKSYGFKIGTVTATQSFDYSVRLSLPTEYRWGIDASAFVELFPTQYFSLLSELHFIQKGFSIPLVETTIAAPEGTGQIIINRPRLDYLAIPLLAKFRMESGAISPYIFAGPRIDVLLGKDDISLEYVRSDFGATLGIGAEFSVMAAPSFLIEGRYSPSFRHAFENENVTVTNKSFEILVGAMF
jgi:hypothetical protein